MNNDQQSVDQAPDSKAAGKNSKLKGIGKWIIRSVAAIILTLLILFAALLIFLDPIIKTAVLTVGPQVAGVNFELEDISVKIFRGRVEITNLVIGNPEGYSSEYAAKLGDVVFETDIFSWLGDGKAIIREIKVKDVSVNYETELPFSNHSNLDDIVNHIKAFAGQPAETESAGRQFNDSQLIPASIVYNLVAALDSPDQDQRRFEIDKLTVENVRLAVVPKDFPKFSAPLTLTLPQMGPVGTNPEGLTGPQIAAALAEQVLWGIVSSVNESSKEIYHNLSTQGMQLADDIRNQTRTAVENIKQEGQKAAETLEETKENLERIGKDARQLWDNIRGK